MSTPILSNRIEIGVPIQHGEYTITPLSRALIVQIPRLGGFIWNRPFALRVNVPGKPAQLIGVRDITRLTLWFIIGIGLLTTSVLYIFSKVRR
jgi:hypothetical protein